MEREIKNSIIVCAYNEEKHLGNCLDSLREQIIDVGSTELLIIDNESKDATCDIAQKFVHENIVDFTSKYIRIDSHVELSRSRNIGISESVGEIVIFVDADACVDKRWLGDLLIGFDDSEVDIVAGKVGNLSNESLFSEFIYKAYFNSIQSFGSSRIIGANMAFRRKVFDVTGGFFNNIRGRGDETAVATRYFTLCPKRQEAYRENAIVYNEFPASLTIWLKQQFREGVSHIVICRLNSEVKSSYYIRNIFRLFNVIFWPLLPLLLVNFNAALLPIIGIVSTRYLYRYKLFFTSFKETYSCMGVIKAVASIPTLFIGTYFLDLGCMTQLACKKGL